MIVGSAVIVDSITGVVRGSVETRDGIVRSVGDNTSFWCESWGGSASDKAVDSEFNGYVKKKGQKHYAPIAEHVRGWR